MKRLPQTTLRGVLVGVIALAGSLTVSEPQARADGSGGYHRRGVSRIHNRSRPLRHGYSHLYRGRSLGRTIRSYGGYGGFYGGGHYRTHHVRAYGYPRAYSYYRGFHGFPRSYYRGSYASPRYYAHSGYRRSSPGPSSPRAYVLHADRGRGRYGSVHPIRRGAEYGAWGYSQPYEIPFRCERPVVLESSEDHETYEVSTPPARLRGETSPFARPIGKSSSSGPLHRKGKLRYVRRGTPAKP